MNSDNTAENTDKEIWREKEGDYYSPSIHVTEHGSIGINVFGTVFVKPVKEWHKIALNHDKLVEALKAAQWGLQLAKFSTEDSYEANEINSALEQITAALAAVEGE